MTAIAPVNLTAKTDLFTNPVGLDGFKFIELASPKQDILKPIFEILGFSKVAHHRSKNIVLFRQGDINFIINHKPTSHATFFAEKHGPSASVLAFRVKGSQYAYNMALDLGVQTISISTRPIELNLPEIKGIVGTPTYLIDFECIGNAPRHQNGSNYTTIDYMTHNDYRGRIGYCGDYYEKLFGFREIRHFDIQEEYTKLKSRALTAPDGQIRIPLNEEASEGTVQIEEFFIAYNYEGIQHIAFSTDNLLGSWNLLKASGVDFMTPPPNTYYQMLDTRLPGHGEPVENLKCVVFY